MLYGVRQRGRRGGGRRRQASRWSRCGRTATSSCGWTGGYTSRGRTRTASSRSSSTRTCASRSSSGACPRSPPSRSRAELNRALSQLSMILELSGNPIAVLENVSESPDIAVRAGRGVGAAGAGAQGVPARPAAGRRRTLHADYVDLIYRTLHDLGETPRTAFGENRARPVRRGAERRAGPAAEEGAAQAADPRGRVPAPQRDGPAAASSTRASATRRTARASFGGRVLPRDRSRLVKTKDVASASTRAAAPPTSWASKTRRRSSAAGWKKSPKCGLRIADCRLAGPVSARTAWPPFITYEGCS